MHPDELEEMGYSERCAESLRAELREDHFDPYDSPEYVERVEEWTAANPF